MAAGPRIGAVVRADGDRRAEVEGERGERGDQVAVDPLDLQSLGLGIVVVTGLVGTADVDDDGRGAVAQQRGRGAGLGRDVGLGRPVAPLGWTVWAPINRATPAIVERGAQTTTVWSSRIGGGVAPSGQSLK